MRYLFCVYISFLYLIYVLIMTLFLGKKAEFFDAGEFFYTACQGIAILTGSINKNLSPKSFCIYTVCKKVLRNAY